jgi:hypothetical protein
MILRSLIAMKGKLGFYELIGLSPVGPVLFGEKVIAGKPVRTTRL